MSVKKFGPFILDRMIGRGGMGAVYRAHDEKTGQIVAVKALLLPLERERERFEAEISTLRLLRHENIVKLYGFGQEDGILYYAMEFVDGPSLATLLRKGRRFTWEETVYIGAQICSALKHAHDRGVIHRDIKPANILLMDDGVVKVSDYGIAQYFGNSRLTNANQVVGTIEFMAPEQAQAGAVTPKTDIYSLGALMYALLTNRPPYVAKTLPELLQKFREGFPEPVRSLRPETPKVVDDVVLDLLQLQPEKRPGDARLIGRRLEALLRTSPTCKDGNPFKSARFRSSSAFRSAPEIVGSGESNSRSAFDESSTTMCKDSESDFQRDEEPADFVQDFPYRAIEDEEGESLDFESPFDKTTERAAAPSGENPSPRPEEERDDFFIGDGADPEFANLSDSETSTSLLRPGESSSKTRAKAETSPAEKKNEGASPRLDPLASDSRSAAASSSEFEISNGADARVESSDAESGRTETKTTDDGGLLSSKSSALNDDAPTLRAESPSPSPSVARLLSSEATTVVDKTTEKRAPEPKKARVVEPQAPSGPPSPSRNVPFEELDAVADELKATPVAKFRKSVFTPVDEEELGEFPDGDETAPSSLFARFRMLWLVLGLIAVAAIVMTAMRPPSADRLYSKIDRAFSRCAARKFDATLRRSEKDMRRFVDLYPNDPRAEKVNYFLCEIQIEELDQRLERMIPNSGRDASCQPIVRAYLEARRAAHDNWEVGSRKLEAFIELFGSDAILAETRRGERVEAPDSETDSGEKKGSSLRGLVVQNRWKLWKGGTPSATSFPDQLVVVAQNRLAALDAEIKTTRRADAALLNDRLIAAEALKDKNPSRAAEIRAAASILYGDSEWARSAFAALRSEGEQPEVSESASDAETPEQSALDSETESDLAPSEEGE